MLFPAASRLPCRSLNASTCTSVVFFVFWLKLTDTASDRDLAPEIVTPPDEPEPGAATGAAITTPNASAASVSCDAEPFIHVRAMSPLPVPVIRPDGGRHAAMPAGDCASP